jgi:integrase
MSAEIAGWRATLPPRPGHGIAQALRQVIDAAVRWGYLDRNPAKLAGPNPKPPPRTVRAYTRAEVDALAAELSPRYRPLPAFAAATGLRPEEWQAAERGDATAPASSTCAAPFRPARSSSSRRRTPAAGKCRSPRAHSRRSTSCRHGSTPAAVPRPRGRSDEPRQLPSARVGPAVEAASVRRPARLYDLRSTYASNSLAAGIDVFELARVMGTSIEMIERHYGTLLTGAAAGIAERQAAFEAALQAEAEQKWR